MSDVDIVVIGAGAAGLAAARRVAALGRPVRVLESRARLGGRAFTSYDFAGSPIELGCGWMHSADENEFAGLAPGLGFTIDKTPPPWRTQWNDIGFPPADQQEFRAVAAQFFERLDAAGEVEPDRAAHLVLEPGCRWNALINAASTYINGVELDGVSAHDFYRYRDTGVNWRIREGYGALIAALGEGLDITYDCPATLIDHAGAQLRIETPCGDLRARDAIVTIPTDVLCAGALRFHPALPDKIEAAAALPLGLADKLYLRLDQADEFPKDSHLYGAIDRVGTGSYHLRPFGRPLIECYFGGRLARDLEAGGETAFAAFAADELASLLGGAIRKRLHPIAASAWARDAHARGSYSHALPGHADARRTLAEPVEGRLFFAGEACSVHDFSTAHGAYRSGTAAADAAVLSGQTDRS
jgi:monoamine oxidase